MKNSQIISVTLAATVSILAGWQQTEAVQLADGTVYFVQPPSLLAATTTFNDACVWSATYYFTVNLPENAGEPLQRVVINQHEGGENIHFRLEDSRAFFGTRRKKGENLPIQEVTTDPNTRSVVVTFDPPIAPGKTITIALDPVRNPCFGGVYLFGVTAFPPGEKAHGQFLGFGRFHFYDRRNFFW